MVVAVRSGQSQRSVARRFGVSLSTVQLWLLKAQNRPLEQVQWEDGSHAPNHQAVKTPEQIETQILDARKFLAEKSDLGEFGAEAIRTHLLEQPGFQGQSVPSVATINRILRRHGVFDSRRRVRRKPPKSGWYLPELASRSSDIDEVDFVEGLHLEGQTQEYFALNLISLHGGWPASWLTEKMQVTLILESLLSHWREHGLPDYAQFDNGNPFAGPRQHPDAIGRVILLCLSLGVTPVFAVPREFGIQSAIEGYNNQWQQKVWQRFHFDNVEEARKQSNRYVSAVRRKRSQRQQAAPLRRVFPADWEYPTELCRKGRIIFLRRTTDKGSVELLGREYQVDAHWCNRLVRCEVDLSCDQIRVYGLRRHAPEEQPLLKEWQYRLPDIGGKRHRSAG
jgi:hypothetical protein